MQETKEKNEVITYNEFINNILNTRGRNGCGDEYHETHHIVPKCMGGDNGKDNLIDLFAREHFVVHRLLALENPENEKIVRAWSMMAFPKSKLHNNARYQLTPEEYEEARIALSLVARKAMTGRTLSEETRKRISQSLKGHDGYTKGKHLSDDTKKKISDANIGKNVSEETRKKIGDIHRGKKLSEEHRQKLSISHMGYKRTAESIEKTSAAHRGKTVSEETRKKMSEIMKIRMVGENNPNYGKPRSDETKRKISESNKHKHNLSTEARLQLKLKFGISVYCVDTCVVYYSANEAESKTNVNRLCIAHCCKGKQKTAGGCHWYYLYDQTCKDGTVISGAITLGLITEEEALKQLEETQQNN